MKLDRVQPALGRRHGGDGAGIRAAQDFEARRGILNRIAVAHPDLLTAFDSPKQSIGVAQIQLGESVFAAVAFLHAAAQDVGHQLLPVANAEHGNAAVK